MPANPDVGRGRIRKRRKNGKTDPHLIVRVKRARDILELRLQGWSLAAIGQAQKPEMCQQRVNQIITAELAKIPKEPAKRVRKMELRRLDDLQVIAAGLAASEEVAKLPYVLPAIGRVLDIQRRRADLLGLDAPTKVENSGPGGGPQEHRISVEDASQSFNAKALLVLEKMRRVREGQT